MVDLSVVFSVARGSHAGQSFVVFCWVGVSKRTVLLVTHCSLATSESTMLCSTTSGTIPRGWRDVFIIRVPCFFGVECLCQRADESRRCRVWRVGRIIRWLALPVRACFPLVIRFRCDCLV